MLNEVVKMVGKKEITEFHVEMKKEGMKIGNELLKKVEEEKEMMNDNIFEFYLMQNGCDLRLRHILEIIKKIGKCEHRHRLIIAAVRCIITNEMKTYTVTYDMNTITNKTKPRAQYDLSYNHLFITLTELFHSTAILIQHLQSLKRTYVTSTRTTHEKNESDLLNKQCEDFFAVTRITNNPFGGVNYFVDEFHENISLWSKNPASTSTSSKIAPSTSTVAKSNVANIVSAYKKLEINTKKEKNEELEKTKKMKVRKKINSNFFSDRGEFFLKSEILSKICMFVSDVLISDLQHNHKSDVIRNKAYWGILLQTNNNNNNNDKNNNNKSTEIITQERLLRIDESYKIGLLILEYSPNLLAEATTYYLKELLPFSPYIENMGAISEMRQNKNIQNILKKKYSMSMPHLIFSFEFLSVYLLICDFIIDYDKHLITDNLINSINKSKEWHDHKGTGNGILLCNAFKEEAISSPK